jgi:DNA polymerase III epsilon subunit-like protein
VRVITAMLVFLDFEASSLANHSYPIEVGWVAEDGAAEAHLIRPAPGWTDWDPEAQAMHGLSREMLQAQGEPHDQVAHRVLEALGRRDVYASAPSWDGKWLSVLLRSAGLPRHAMRLKDSDAAHLHTALDILRPVHAGRDLQFEAARLVAEARRHAATGRPAHRALADARQELDVWLEVRRLAQAAVARSAPA